MKIVSGNIIIKGFAVAISGIKSVDVRKPATFEFHCNAEGTPNGGIGKGKASLHLWLGSSGFIEHFGGAQTRTIKRLCKSKAQKMRNELLGEAK